MFQAKLQKLFPKPNKLEFEEEIYVRFLILTKKRYMYTKYKDEKIDKRVGKERCIISKKR